MFLGVNRASYRVKNILVFLKLFKLDNKRKTCFSLFCANLIDLMFYMLIKSKLSDEFELMSNIWCKFSVLYIWLKSLFWSSGILCWCRNL